MLGSRFRKKKEDAVSGFLGSQTEFSGKLSFSGVVHLDGNFEGEIISRGTLVVGSESLVNASIHSKILKIAGEVHGDLSATERIELYPPAKVHGNIRTPSLVVEEGVMFEGNCSMSSVQDEVGPLVEAESEEADEQEAIEVISAHAWPPTYEEGSELDRHRDEESQIAEPDR